MSLLLQEEQKKFFFGEFDVSSATESESPRIPGIFLDEVGV